MNPRERFVMDATVPLAWCFQSPRGRYAERVLVRLERSVGLVPPPWHWELASALQLGRVRGALPEVDLDRFVRLVELLPIRTVPLRASTVGEALTALGPGAPRLHDAIYVILAKQEGVPLASCDDAVRGAARRAAVHVLE